MVNYQAVFGNSIDNADVIHRALDYLTSVKYKLAFNDSFIMDKIMLAYPGLLSNGGKSILSLYFIILQKMWFFHYSYYSWLIYDEYYY